MSAQRYSDQLALDRMAEGLCPECGKIDYEHLDDNRYWIPRRCSLLPRGVTDRIEQFNSDRESADAAT
jgi:hypothetical protein